MPAAISVRGETDQGSTNGGMNHKDAVRLVLGG